MGSLDSCIQATVVFGAYMNLINSGLKKHLNSNELQRMMQLYKNASMWPSLAFDILLPRAIKMLIHENNTVVAITIS